MKRTVVHLAALAAVTLASCSGEPVVYGIAGADVAPYEVEVDATALGLITELEDVSARIAVVEQTYAEALSVYSLRRDDLVQATLQVTRLNEAASVDDEDFRLALVSTLGSRAPRAIRVGDHQVWLTTGTEQTLAAWFHHDRFFVLAVRAEYEEPRRLLRAMLAVEA